MILEMDYKFYGSSWLITGRAILNKKGFIEGANIRSNRPCRKIIRPFYEAVEGYFEAHTGSTNTIISNELARTFSALKKIQDSKNVTSVISDAVESLVDAKTHLNPVTSIARFVESSEAILALSRSEFGQKSFAKRGLKFLDKDIQNGFIDLTDENKNRALIKQLYRIRNARMHGKGSHDVVQEELARSRPI